MTFISNVEESIVNQNLYTLKTFTILFVLILLVVGCGTEPAEQDSAVSATINSTTQSTGTAAKLNLNEASEEQFLTVPDVGNRMVREFMEYRPYVSIQQFRQEIGKYVSDEQVTAYEQYVFVPIDVNDADAETLKQIPTVDDSIAAELIAGRPYATNDDFLAKLATYISETDLETAESYLTTP